MDGPDGAQHRPQVRRNYSPDLKQHLTGILGAVLCSSILCTIRFGSRTAVHYMFPGLICILFTNSQLLQAFSKCQMVKILLDYLYQCHAHAMCWEFEINDCQLWG